MVAVVGMQSFKEVTTGAGSVEGVMVGMQKCRNGWCACSRT